MGTELVRVDHVIPSSVEAEVNTSESRARRIGRRVVKGSFKWAVLLASFFVAMAIIGTVSEDAKESVKDSIPACEHEDGSTQEICIFRSEHGRDVINVDHGRTYYVQAG